MSLETWTMKVDIRRQAFTFSYSWPVCSVNWEMPVTLGLAMLWVQIGQKWWFLIVYFWLIEEKARVYTLQQIQWIKGRKHLWEEQKTSVRVYLNVWIWKESILQSLQTEGSWAPSSRPWRLRTTVCKCLGKSVSCCKKETVFSNLIALNMSLLKFRILENSLYVFCLLKFYFKCFRLWTKSPSLGQWPWFR